MIRFLFLMGAVLPLVGCLSLTSSQKPPVTYALHAGQDEPSNTSRFGVMLVVKPGLPAGFETEQIGLYLDAGRRFDHYSGARWLAPLDDVLQDAIVQAGRQALPRMIIDTPDINIPADYRLAIKVNEFAPFYKVGTDQVPMLQTSLTFTLVNAVQENVLTDFTIRRKQQAASNNISSVTVGLEELLQSTLSEAYGHIGLRLAKK